MLGAVGITLRLKAHAHLRLRPERRVSLGQVWSWGDGDYGKLGRGGSDGCKTPKLIEKLQDLDVVKVRCGSQFSVALTKDGQVYSWGKGDNQRLGHGTEEHVRYPKLLEALQGERAEPLSSGGGFLSDTRVSRLLFSSPETP